MLKVIFRLSASLHQIFNRLSLLLTLQPNKDSNLWQRQISFADFGRLFSTFYFCAETECRFLTARV